MFILTGLGMIRPYLAMLLIDRGIRGQEYWLITQLAAAVIIIAAARGVFHFTQYFLVEGFGQRSVYDLRNALYRKLPTLSWNFYDDAQTGQLMARLTGDVEGIRVFLSAGIATWAGSGDPSPACPASTTACWRPWPRQRGSLSSLTPGRRCRIYRARLMRAPSRAGCCSTTSPSATTPAGPCCMISLLADPRILILDEATASIDTRTEVLVQDALRTLLKGRTSFVIAHRLSTIREADRILVIDRGRIAKEGTHHELLARRSVYYNLLRAQFGLDAEEVADRSTAPTMALS